jgi:hypothetical protein
MISFSKSGLIDDLLGALPAGEDDADRVVIALAKAQLESTRSEGVNGAHINVNVRHIPQIFARQVDIQIAGKRL